MALAPFIDNRSLKLAEALGQHLRSIRKGLDVHLDIASGFFDLPGFLILASHLQKGDSVNLLLGAEPPREADLPAPKPGDPVGSERLEQLLRAALNQQFEAIATARDRLPFSKETDEGIGRLHEMLRDQRLTVKRLETQFLPARGILVRSSGGGSFIGEANLTLSGLSDNPTVVLGHSGSAAVSALWNWFDTTWESAVQFDLGAVFPRLTANETPYLVYLRTLYALYGEDLEQEAANSQAGKLPITTFQTHGVNRAERIIEKYGGALIADGVGLGKTFTAGELIRKYRERRQRVLLICPATLRDGTWKEFQDRFDLRFETMSYEELAADEQLGGTKKTLAVNLEEYQLIVIDEAHNYRNPGSPKRAGVLRQLLGGPVPKDVLLLTATPVNNSLWDLYNLLGYFLKSDGALADRGVSSLKEPFDIAMSTQPDSLSPDVLWPVLDATTVKRTRQFVKKHYQNEQIKLLNGQTVPLTFPEPKPSTIKYKLDAVLPGFIGELESALMPPAGDPKLKLARYQPDRYQNTGTTGEGTVIGLLRSAILKRFESSVHAFQRTVSKMIKEHEFFLKGLDDQVIYRGELLREVSAADDEDVDDLLDELAEKLGPGLSTSGYDLKRLKKDVESDLALLKDFEAKAKNVPADYDPKLGALADELAAIAEEAETDGVDEEAQRRNRKVLIFSYFSDTVDWIYSYLEQAVRDDARLEVYKGRLAAVTGGDSEHGINRETAIAGFAPETSGSRRGQDRFDILVTTDVLAEGVNLQMCRNIINYDLPWNPMRLVQRHGRVDRIGSPHRRVFLRTFFPDQELDRLLALEFRVKAKLAQAAASVGLEAPPIENSASGDHTFTETRKEIEKLMAGDATIYESGGTSETTQSSEEYRQELRKALARIGQAIRTLPWRSGSGRLLKGSPRGYVFTACVGEHTFMRFVPYGANEKKQALKNDALCLRKLECSEPTQRVLSDELLNGAFDAWELARQSIYDEWLRDTDPANLQPKVTPFLHELAQFLRSNPPIDTTPEGLAELISIISGRIPRRNEIRLREVFAATYPGNKAKSAAVAKALRETGLQPAKPRSPLPPISEEEIHLVCWMGIEP